MVQFGPNSFAIDDVLERTHIALWHGSDQQATDEFRLFAVGGIIVTEDAAAVGITAIPGPISDLNADWFWHAWIVSRFEQATTVGFESSAGSFERFDVKSRRKIPADKVFSFVAETDSASAGVTIQFATRFLTRLQGT